MRPISAWRLSLAFLSACLQILGFPTGGPIGPVRAGLNFVALVPLLVTLLRRHKADVPIRPLHLFSLGYFCGIVWYLGSCSWIYQTMYLYGGLPKSIALLILVLFSLYLGLYHGLFALLIGTLSRTRFGTIGALILSPVVWVAVELARARITGFPWDLLGNSQIDNSVLIRLAPVGGVLCISLVVAAVNTALSAPWVCAARHRWLTAGGAAGLIALIELLGVRPHTREAADQTAMMLQENIAVGAAAQGTVRLSQQEELDDFSRLSMDRNLYDPDARKPAIVIWPEAPAGFQSNEPDVLASLGTLARRVDAPLVIGLLGVDMDRSAAAGYRLYDSAAVLNRAGLYLGRYDKTHLVPWGEYVPFKEFFRFADRLTAGTGNMDPGRSRSVFTLEGHRYGIFICYESIFGDEVREFVKNGAEVLVNISDDGWYGDSGAPWQHLNMARMRAVENHRWVIRDTNTGETTTIDPWGNYTRTARHLRTAYALPFGFSNEMTFYAQHGDWLAYLCAAMTLASLAYAVGSRPRRT